MDFLEILGKNGFEQKLDEEFDKNPDMAGRRPLILDFFNIEYYFDKD